MIEVGDKVRINRNAVMHCSFRPNTSYKPSQARGSRPSMWIRPKGIFTVTAVGPINKTSIWWVARDARMYCLKKPAQLFNLHQMITLDRPVNPKDKFSSCNVQVKDLVLVRKGKKSGIPSLSGNG